MSEAYHKLEKIGEGTFGVVFKAREKSTGRIVALKKIHLNEDNEGVPATTIREVSLLKALKHSTIINLEAILYKNDKMYLAMEYLDSDLRKYLDKIKKADSEVPKHLVKRFVQQIITAVEFCHSRAILHRDLKPQNILISSDMNLKLADFGLGRSVGIPLRTYTKDVVTLWYRPPELLLGQRHYSESVDMWSVGAIIAELIVLEPIFYGDSEIDQIYKIFKILGTPNETQWPGVTRLPSFACDYPEWSPIRLDNFLGEDNEVFIDLVGKLLVYNPIGRLSARKSLRHEYLKGMEPILE